MGCFKRNLNLTYEELNMVTLDGREVRVGDGMFCLLKGKCIVQSVQKDCLITNCGAYKADGIYSGFPQSTRLLYWDRPTIIAPTPPVKTWQWIALVGGRWMLSHSHYATLEGLVRSGGRSWADADPYLPSEKEIAG